ncbi:hypothetical protein HF265_19080 [Rhizobium leguminosarum]|uniref:hypothetical protein n=1 Tax=Rhizobium leguminosarum TaxID=384 RepID=UPI001C911037|nr:hypothetical protein [Rhizobium leguminosarum]MBY3031168.1 hypothetical protein [Rhizobium leguminosarum]
MVVKAIIDHPVADWVYRRANERLSGRALSCAVNARNHLVRAQRIADEGISNTIAYFCATHATEEAVAAFITSAKEHGYRKLAGKVNIRDHAQKAVVAAYVQIIAGYAQDMKLAVAHHSESDDVIARVLIGYADKVYPLGLRLFSFNENGGIRRPKPLSRPSLAYFRAQTRWSKGFIRVQTFVIRHSMLETRAAPP